MPIVFSAITPHPPLLIPNIGKENINLLKDTVKAYKTLEEDLYVSQPDTIIIISPHGHVQTQVFTMNLSPEYNADFKEFGDFSTSLQLRGDIGLAYKIRERMETRAPLSLVSESNIDHGSSVPLFLLTPHLPQVKIIPIYYSGLNLEAHYQFGELLRRELLVSRNRIAVVASGDLSHRLTKNSPAGYSPKAKKFDQKVIESLLKCATADIIAIKETLLNEVAECGLKSFIILLGIINSIKCRPQLYSYESPFGVGYAVINFKV